jgi:hypothetical protein
MASPLFSQMYLPVEIEGIHHPYTHDDEDDRHDAPGTQVVPVVITPG